VPISDKDELKKIYHFIKYKYAKLYKFFILAQSASALVKQESYINKEDIEFLPFPENEEYLKLSLEEEIIKDDILNYYVHLGKAIGNNAAGKILHKKVTEEQLRGFGKVFCDSLNVIYEQHLKNFVAKWQYGSIYQTETFTIYEFKYGPSNNKSYYSFNNIKKENLNDYLNNLIFNSKDKTSTTYIRVAKYYEHTNGYDCVFFVKPNATYYWLKSIALRDSDETLMDLNKAGF
jgi:hypothetical protein